MADIDRRLKDEAVFSLSKGLSELEHFITSVKPLAEDIGDLARFICRSVPMQRLVLICMVDESVEEIADWSQEGDANRLDEYIRAALPELRELCFQKSYLHSERLKELVADIRRRAGLRPDSCQPVLFPIFSQEQLGGLALFDRGFGEWLPTEIQLLESLSSILSISFASRHLNRDYALQSWVFNELMDNMNANLYVTDIETDQILFMNKTMKRTFRLDNPEGKVCWKVLQDGMDSRCDFCPVNILKRSKSPQPSHLWEEHNSVTGRVYENYDSLMRWTDGRVVHFQQSQDITETKRLTHAASTDELTGALNRRAGKERLEKTLLRARETNGIFTICMFDLDGLKTVNDTYGHAEGDIFILETAKAVREFLHAGDYMIRLSGDEFLVMYDARETEAVSRIRQARKRLLERADACEMLYTPSFSYGLLEVRPGGSEDLNEILRIIDDKMYEQKRRNHIQQAESLLKEVSPPPEQNAEFTYDKELLYDALLQSTDDYLYLCNMKTNTFRYPKSMVEEFELPAEVIRNAAAVWGAHVHEHDKQTFLEANQEIADGRADSHCVDYRAKNRKGEWVWVRCRGHMERDKNGEPSLFAGFITNLGKKNKIDHMTGLLNKFEFENEVQRLLDLSPERSLGVLLLGMDDFRHVNDLYDRLFGDEVLRITARRLQSILPPTANVYRLDGDEFGVVFRGVNQQRMRDFYARVQETFSRQQLFDGRRYFCTLSGGAASYPADGKTYLDLMKYSSYSLEYAKRRGKNRLVFFSREILSHKERSLELTELLRESIENDYLGFELYYQPQICASSGALKGAEALCRWSCGKYGAISPVEFVPLLEESGLILPAGRWIFDQAVKTCRKWCGITEDFAISINLSYLQLDDASFLQFMRETLQRYRVDPSHVVVELTESYIASNIATLTDIFRQIRSIGLRIAMDDFGTGYSSLGILKLSPADIVKIDKTFVRDIQHSTFDTTFIRFIVELCHDVDIRVCLEGVETEEEYQIVRAMNLDLIQGYLFGRPIPKQEFEERFLYSNYPGEILADKDSSPILAGETKR